MIDDDREAWAPLIAERREQLGLTQEQLGRAADVSEKTIYNIEAGGRRPQARTLRKVQDALGLTTDLRVARMIVQRRNDEEEDLRFAEERRVVEEEWQAAHSAIALARRERLWSAIRARHLGDSRGLLGVVRIILDNLDADALDEVFDALVDPTARGYDLHLRTKQYEQDARVGASGIEIAPVTEPSEGDLAPSEERNDAEQG